MLSQSFWSDGVTDHDGIGHCLRLHNTGSSRVLPLSWTGRRLCKQLLLELQVLGETNISLLLSCNILFQLLNNLLLFGQLGLKLCDASLQSFDFLLFLFDCLFTLGFASITRSLCLQHCLETRHLHFELFVVLLKLTHIFLSTLDLSKLCLCSPTASTTLNCNGCRSELPVGCLVEVHAAVGLDLSESIDSTNRASAVLSLEKNGACARFVVFDADDLHAEVVGKKLTCLSLTKFPPSSTPHATTVPPLNSESSISRNEVSPPLLHTLHPALNQRTTGILVEHPVTLQFVVWSLPHEHL
mmetsp:Transcript_13171/g.28794  ORF Transcript_13171/g.28794 Transcript_13171/m.28794 type:complete len:299 (+) Transcript_13171:1636-2532(+)